MVKMTNEGMVKIDLKFLAKLLTIGIEHMPFEATTKHDVVYAYSFATLNNQYDYCKMFVEIANNSTFKIQGSKRTKTVYCKDVKKLLSTIFAGKRIKDVCEIFKIDNNFIDVLRESLKRYPIDPFELYFRGGDTIKFSTTDDNINEIIELSTLERNSDKIQIWHIFYKNLWTEAGRNYYKIKMGE